MHSISEVIFLNNDQHQHKKQQQQTTGLIQRLSNNFCRLVLLSQRSFVSENVCLLFASLPRMDNNSLAKQARGIE